MPPVREKFLAVRGAREHNLKNVSCDLPHQRLVVITGPSGSGKSSLAFDTIYAEGQRRYVESLSVYARQFLDRLPKPQVDSIEGLSPAIALEQKAPGKNPRSTVGTVTEIADYLRVLFARTGVPHSPISGKVLQSHSAQQIVDVICNKPNDSRVTLLAPIVRNQKGNLAAELDALRRDGFVRARIDSVAVDLSDDPSIDPNQGHDLQVVIDRIVVRSGITARVTDSVELALKVGDGTLLLDDAGSANPEAFSERWINWEENISFPALEPSLFSFNSPVGACPACGGLGVTSRVDLQRLIPDPTRTLRAGALLALGRPGSPAAAEQLNLLVQATGVDADKPWNELTPAQIQVILHGTEATRGKSHTGVLRQLEHLRQLGDAYDPTDEELQEGALSPDDLARFLSEQQCPSCSGARLCPQALAVRVGDKNIAQLCDLPLPELWDFFKQLGTSKTRSNAQRVVGEPLIQMIVTRLGFLIEVGLPYLTLARLMHTLSGGESQRIRLASQLGTSLVGVLYVLDEPSVGLHARDNQQLLAAVRRLVDSGNSVILVEHDRDAILCADHVVDMGPKAGEHGGQIVAEGTVAAVLENPHSISAPYLNGQRSMPAPERRKTPGHNSIRIVGANSRNLKDLTVDLPLGLLTAITGVSGSGKTTLLAETLLPAALAHLRRSPSVSGCKEVLGLEHIDRIVSVDQSPIGRTPRSNPASYTGILPHLRELFASLPDARARGYRAGRFSFNIKGGRCETCQGEGTCRIEMHFLPDVFVPCDVCGGARYNRETLEIRYRGYSIADVLGLTVEQASALFAAVPKLGERLTALSRLGLDYLRLGQPANTLSGGEAQRIKLATELARPATGRTLYLLDEPTTGLHFADIELLLTALLQLRDAGNSVLVIEHNLDLIACADWVIDLGPEGGPHGGQLVAQGTPEQVAVVSLSHTGRFLAPLLRAGKASKREKQLIASKAANKPARKALAKRATAQRSPAKRSR
ncbi:MAG TPA: excinuclease ABC subunit UvrA [Polyangiaceae bacterium]|nr:excinuclease ABC subunit UvrA [Polyangiaceae bacterium]